VRITRQTQALARTPRASSAIGSSSAVNAVFDRLGRGVSRVSEAAPVVMIIHGAASAGMRAAS
jgi:hypothetical protein